MKSNILEIVIVNTNQSVFVNVMLLFLMALSVVVPTLVIFLFNDLIKISFLFTLILFLGSFSYFLKIFLWKNFGKEIFILNNKNNTIEHFFDFSLFKKKPSRYLFNNLSIDFLKVDNLDTIEPSLLRITIDDTELISIIPVDYNKQEEIKGKLFKWGISKKTETS